jgi:hypothetical protein
VANPVSAVSQVPLVAQAHDTQAEKPAVNVTRPLRRTLSPSAPPEKRQARRSPPRNRRKTPSIKARTHERMFQLSDPIGRNAGLRHNDHGVPVAVAFFVRRRAGRI